MELLVVARSSSPSGYGFGVVHRELVVTRGAGGPSRLPLRAGEPVHVGPRPGSGGRSVRLRGLVGCGAAPHVPGRVRVSLVSQGRTPDRILLKLTSFVRLVVRS